MNEQPRRLSEEMRNAFVDGQLDARESAAILEQIGRDARLREDVCRARLVKEMSEKVQFIYITHNKIAMEMAEQLMGVTMHEPGCSRLVAVDVAEAMQLVES